MNIFTQMRQLVSVGRLIRAALFLGSVVYGSIMVVGGRFIVFFYRDWLTRVPDPKPINTYTYEDIQFKTADGITLHGWFIRSHHNPTNRTLVVLHGWQCTRARMIEYVRLFVDAGYHVLTYDQRGHGASEIAMITFGPAEGRDLLAAINYAKTRPDVNPDLIGAFGLSMGGSAIIHAAAEQPDLFKAVIFEGPFACSYDIARHIIESSMNYFLALTVEAALTAGVKLWSMGRLSHSTPSEYVSKLVTPLMIIYGEDDHVVPPYSAKRFIDAAPLTAEIWITPAGKHTQALDFYPAEFRRRVLGFFAQHMTEQPNFAPYQEKIAA